MIECPVCGNLSRDNYCSYCGCELLEEEDAPDDQWEPSELGEEE